MDNLKDIKSRVTNSNNKALRKQPPKAKQFCCNCKHWHKNGGGCASAGGRCSNGMYLDKNFNVTNYKK